MTLIIYIYIYLGKKITKMSDSIFCVSFGDSNILGKYMFPNV